jgi:GntR family transcriptional regulator, transcriptional repressor for pyruvate dehydrogenase complex
MVMKKENSKRSLVIVRDILSKIQKGEYLLQSRLPSEMALANTYKVGRSTVREALGVLKSYGIISSRQGGGNYVAEDDLHTLVDNLELNTDEYSQIKSLLELRFTLEPQAAYLAAERRTDEDIVQLRNALNRIRETFLSSNSAGQEEDFLFHKSVFQATHNPYMIRVLEDLSIEFEKALSITLTQNIGLMTKRQSVYKEHEDIFNAIEEGKPELARVLCKMHLENVQKKLNYLFWFQE